VVAPVLTPAAAVVVVPIPEPEVDVEAETVELPLPVVGPTVGGASHEKRAEC